MSTISPTAFARALVQSLVPAGTRLSLNEPNPQDLVQRPDGNWPVHVQLYMLDGWRDRHEQHPEIEIVVYSRRFLDAERVAQAIEIGLVRYPVRVQVGERVAVLDRTDVTTSTREVPWDTDTGVSQFIGSYQLRTRS